MHIIDLNALSDMFLGDTGKVRIVVDALIQRIPEWQAEAQKCMAVNDLEKTRQLCHQIRGSAGSIKAEKLAEAATILGDFIKSNQVNKVQNGFDHLNNCLEEILSTSSNLSE